MHKTFEAEGNLPNDILSLLVLELDSAVQSWTLGNNKVKITVYEARDGIEEALKKYGLENIKEINRKAS